MLLGSCAPLNAIQQALGLNADRAPQVTFRTRLVQKRLAAQKHKHDVRCDFAFAYTFPQLPFDSVAQDSGLQKPFLD